MDLELLEVARDSDARTKHALADCARGLQRQFWYDWPPYSVSPDDSCHDHGSRFFLAVTGNRVHGGMGFVRYVNVREPVMSWLWLRPSSRRRGIMTRLWPELIARFGVFAVDGPFSRPMLAFMAARPAHRLLRNWEPADEAPARRPTRIRPLLRCR